MEATDDKPHKRRSTTPNNSNTNRKKKKKNRKKSKSKELPVYNNGLIVATKQIKKSGQAIVYQGKFSTPSSDNNKTQDVAIKVYLCPRQGWEECQAEIDMFFQLRQQHANVMRILDFFAKPQPALVTPYIPGGDLLDYLQNNGRFSDAKQANEILRGIGEGVAHLHKHDIVHRDLKSPNIVLQPVVMDKDDDKPWFRPVLIDLGHAAIMPRNDNNSHEDDNQQLVTHCTTCTYAWRPPEMILHYQYSPKTDMYALGIVMWEILTGEFPYRGCDEDWIMGFVANDMGRPDQIEFVEDDTDDTEESDDDDNGVDVMNPAYQSLMEQLWHQEPNERPSASEFLVALAKIARLVRMGEKKKKMRDDTKKSSTSKAIGEIIDLCSLQSCV